jgi:hypothetical protein
MSRIHPEHRDGLRPAANLPRRDAYLLDNADPDPADAHLVARDQVGCAGQLHPQVVGGDERQAGVRL